MLGRRERHLFLGEEPFLYLYCHWGEIASDTRARVNENENVRSSRGVASDFTLVATPVSCCKFANCSYHRLHHHCVHRLSITRLIHVCERHVRRRGRSGEASCTVPCEGLSFCNTWSRFPQFPSSCKKPHTSRLRVCATQLPIELPSPASSASRNIANRDLFERENRKVC